MVSVYTNYWIVQELCIFPTHSIYLSRVIFVSCRDLHHLLVGIYIDKGIKFLWLREFPYCLLFNWISAIP